jgi:(R,R)-butanediol dehydrogenase / meso-butanediol dehydrogenase / diacetyl reductase
MKTMLAARYVAPHRIETEKVTLPEIDNEEALVEVEACGFCGSDISIVAGTHPRAKAPLTLGHELSGRIVQIRSSQFELAVGDRVTTYPLISCGNCYACKNGSSHVCRDLRLYGFDLDGGMAQFVRLPASSLMKLPNEMPARIGALIEPLAVAVHGVARANLQNVKLAAVLGAGPIGLLTALVARARGIPQVIISDVVPARIELAESFGLQAAAAGEDLHRIVMGLTNQNGADVVFECAGHPSSAKEMCSLVRSRGVIVNLGVFKNPVAMNMQTINFKEIELLGSRVYERKDFQVAIDLAMTLPLERIVTRVYPLQEVSAAFERFRSGEECKVLILPMGNAK